MDEITEEDLNSIKGGPAMVEDKYPGINRRYAIWMDWVGIPVDHEKIADSSTMYMLLARRCEGHADYPGIYSIWLDFRLDDWVRTLKYFERCDKDACDVCRRWALETPYGGVSGHKLFDDWLEAWCKKNKCPVRFVNYKKEMEEFEREYEEEEKTRQARRLC